MSIQMLFVPGAIALFLIAGNGISSAQVKRSNAPGAAERAWDDGSLCLKKGPPITLHIDSAEVSTSTPSVVHLTVKQTWCIGPGDISLVVGIGGTDCKTVTSLQLEEHIKGPTEHKKTVDVICPETSFGCKPGTTTLVSASASWSDFPPSSHKVPAACPKKS